MSRRRVLVIDDCVDSHELIRAALEDDYEVFGIKDPRRYADAIAVAQPDLVILDMLMPGLSGMEILDRIEKEKGPAKKIPFVVLSAKRNIDEQKKAYGRGVKLYLNKPFEPPRLLRNIQMFFEDGSLPEREKAYKIHELDYQMELRESSTSSTVAPQNDVPEGEMKSEPKGVTSAGTSSVKKRLKEDAEDSEPEPRWMD